MYCRRNSTSALFVTAIVFLSLRQYTSLKSRAHCMPQQSQQVLVQVQNDVPDLQHYILVYPTSSRTRPYLKSEVYDVA
jgi:hypothetical protein